MATPKIAAQMYTIREFVQTPAGIQESFRKLQTIGYTAVQVSGIGPIAHQDLKDMADEYGLTICATHIGFDKLAQDIEDVIHQHKLWDCKYVGLGSMPGSYQHSRKGYVSFAQEAFKFAAELHRNGLRFIYHNHSFEFVKFDGKTGMDILLEESDPAVFDFELDTYWVQHGGGDPVDWIRRVEGRMDVVHFKDMVIGPERTQIMAEVGEGNLNWKGIVKACQDSGVVWAAVEQDVCRRDPFESLTISLNNLKTMGLTP